MSEQYSLKEKPKNFESPVTKKQLRQAIGLFLILMLLMNFFSPVRPRLFMRERPSFPYNILGLVIDGINPSSNADFFPNPLSWLFLFLSPLFIVMCVIYVVNNLFALKILGGAGTIQQLFIKTHYYAAAFYGILATSSYWAAELTLKSGYTIGSVPQEAYQNYVLLSYAIYILVWMFGSFGISRVIIRAYQLQNSNFVILFLTNMSIFFCCLIYAYLIASLLTGDSVGRY